MACFIVSAATAAVVSVAKHIVANKENKNIVKLDNDASSNIKWSKKLSYLELALWGGSFLLLGEHIIHGEITPFFPFITAMSNKNDTIEMLHEMGTVGVLMSLSIILAWSIGLLVLKFISYKKRKHEKEIDIVKE